MTSARPREDEVKSLGAAFVELELESQEGAGRLRREQSEDFLAPPARAHRQGGRRRRRGDHDRRDSRPQSAGARHRRDGACDDAGAASSSTSRPRAGGNCELSRAGEVARPRRRHDRRGEEPAELEMADRTRASSTRATSPSSSTLVVKDGEFAPDFDDEIVVGTCVTHAGEVRHVRPVELLEGGSP